MTIFSYHCYPGYTSRITLEVSSTATDSLGGIGMVSVVSAGSASWTTTTATTYKMKKGEGETGKENQL